MQASLALPPAAPAAIATPARETPKKEPAAPAPAVNPAAAFAAMLSQIGDTAAAAAVAAVRPEIEEAKRAAEAAAKGARPVVVSFTLPERPEPVKLPEGETAHPALAPALAILRTGEPLYLVGPTGSGKTHLAEQAAAVLFPDRAPADRFGTLSVSGEISTGDIFGRLAPIPAKDGAGLAFEFRESAFVRIYRDGGVFLFDELDAADPSVALVVNQAFANGAMNIPGQGTIKRNPNCYLLAAGNTNGQGATRDYTGRARLDAATLNRFEFLPVDYDAELEKRLAIAYAGDETRAAVVLDARDTARRSIQKARLSGVFFSTRAVIRYAKFMRAGIVKTRLDILNHFANALPEDKRALILAA